MVDPSSLRLGKRAEEAAAQYYLKQGYEILERNFRCGHKELDLICRKDRTIVFVEVKAARSKTYGSPENWIDANKRRNLIRAAQGYIQVKNISGYDFRFDVITYIRFMGEIRLNHLPAAFDASENP